MDTGNLSKEAYDGIILETEKFNHDLTLQFGVLAESCEAEAEYLKKAKELIEEIRTLNSEDLEDVFFGSITNTVSLYSTLDKLLLNIEKVEKIPIAKRHYEL